MLTAAEEIVLITTPQKQASDNCRYYPELNKHDTNIASITLPRAGIGEPASNLRPAHCLHKRNGTLAAIAIYKPLNAENQFL